MTIEPISEMECLTPVQMAAIDGGSWRDWFFYVTNIYEAAKGLCQGSMDAQGTTPYVTSTITYL